MPAFGIGTNSNNIDSGEVRGKTYDIACKVWFPTNQEPYPLSFKFKGDDDIIVSVSNLNIKYTEGKTYYGEKAKEYKCETVIGGLRKEFKLIFYLESCKWIMII